MTIRQGDSRDLDAITAVNLASWASTGLAQGSDLVFEQRRRRLAACLADGGGLYVAEDGGAVVGFMIFSPADGYLSQLFVAPEHQGRGIGRSLLDIARRLATGSIRLRTPMENLRAIGWYEREGFVKDGEAAHPDAPHRVLAYYRLPPPAA